MSSIFNSAIEKAVQEKAFKYASKDDNNRSPIQADIAAGRIELDQDEGISLGVELYLKYKHLLSSDDTYSDELGRKIYERKTYSPMARNYIKRTGMEAMVIRNLGRRKLSEDDLAENLREIAMEMFSKLANSSSLCRTPISEVGREVASKKLVWELLNKDEVTFTLRLGRKLSGVSGAKAVGIVAKEVLIMDTLWDLVTLFPEPDDDYEDDYEDEEDYDDDYEDYYEEDELISVSDLY